MTFSSESGFTPCPGKTSLAHLPFFCSWDHQDFLLEHSAFSLKCSFFSCFQSLIFRVFSLKSEYLMWIRCIFYISYLPRYILPLSSLPTLKCMCFLTHLCSDKYLINQQIANLGPRCCECRQSHSLPSQITPCIN